MKITHRIAWASPYCFTEIEHEAGQAVDYADLAEQAISMEAAWLAVGGGTRSHQPVQEPPPVIEDGDPGPQDEHVADEFRRPTQAPRTSPPSGTNGGRASASSKRGSGLLCPDHDGVELMETKPEYQEYDEGPNGEKVPAKFFCPGKENGTGKNHSVWRSRAVVA